MCLTSQSCADRRVELRVHELGREPVEQLGVRRPFALRAEIVEHLRQPGPEELAPRAVDERARGERIVARHQPVREIEPRRALALRVERAEESRNRRLDDRRRLVHPVAARQDARLRRLHRHRRDDARDRRVEQAALGLQPLHLSIALRDRGIRKDQILAHAPWLPRHHGPRAAGAALSSRPREDRSPRSSGRWDPGCGAACRRRPSAATRTRRRRAPAGSVR